MAFPADYTKYQTVTISSSKVPGNLSNYVLLLDLSDFDKAGADLFDTCRSDGGDLRATSGDGSTQYAIEVVNINTTSKTGEVYVRVSDTVSASVDTDVRIYYNGIDTADAAGATYGSQAVWSGYRAVYHMNEDPSTTNPQDSTSNGHHLTRSGTFASGDSVTGLFGIGKAIYISSANALITPAGALEFEITDDFGLMFYGEQDDNTNNNVWFAAGTSGNKSWQLYMRKPGAVYDNLYVHIRQDASKEMREYTNPAGTIGLDTPFFGGFSYDGSADDAGLDIWVDGAQPSTTVQEDSIGTGDDITDNQTTVLLPVSDSGTMDEVRVRETEFTPDEWGAYYNNFNSPSTFYSVGNEETASGVIQPQFLGYAGL